MTVWAAGVWADGVWAAGVWLDLEPVPSGPAAEPGESATGGRLLDPGARAGTLAVRFMGGVLTDDGLTFVTLDTEPLSGSIVPQEPLQGALVGADLLTGRLTVAALTGRLTASERLAGTLPPGHATGRADPATPQTGRLEDQG